MERKNLKFGTSKNQEMEQAKHQKEPNTWKQQGEKARSQTLGTSMNQTMERKNQTFGTGKNQAQGQRFSYK
jgi:hypothetical protein